MEKQVVPPEGYRLALPGDICRKGDLYFEDDGDKEWHLLCITKQEQYDPETHYPRAIKIVNAETATELLSVMKAIYVWLTDNNCPDHYKILRVMRIVERYIPRKER